VILQIRKFRGVPFQLLDIKPWAEAQQIKEQLQATGKYASCSPAAVRDARCTPGTSVRPILNGRMHCIRWHSTPCSAGTICRTAAQPAAAAISVLTGAAVSRTLVAWWNRENR
jgi:hypothetical protein